MKDHALKLDSPPAGYQYRMPVKHSRESRSYPKCAQSSKEASNGAWVCTSNALVGTATAKKIAAVRFSTDNAAYSNSGLTTKSRQYRVLTLWELISRCVAHFQARVILSTNLMIHSFQHLDSYHAFRSDFIHFSISVVANEPNSPANTLHLTPNGFVHFSAWWHLFDGTLSLPVRHGPIFESSLPPSKKFGKSCATIKYRIQLAPVYIAHTFKQESAEDARKGISTVLGVKGRLEQFNVDMHQREQETRTRTKDSQDVQVRLHKAFHRVEVDCEDTDLRVVSARFTCPILMDTDGDSEYADMTDFLNMDTAEPVSPEDIEWVDEDDYIDLYTVLGERQPNMHLLSCLKTPRLSYSRFAQHDYLHPPLRNGKVYTGPGSTPDGEKPAELGNAEVSREDPKGPVSKFGQEGSHLCLLDRAKGMFCISTKLRGRY